MLRRQVLFVLTLIKKEENFPQIKGILSGAVAKSYRRKGFLIYEEIRKYGEAVSYE